MNLYPGKLAYSPLSARSIHKLSTSPIINTHVSFVFSLIGNRVKGETHINEVNLDLFGIDSSSFSGGGKKAQEEGEQAVGLQCLTFTSKIFHCSKS